MPTRRTVLAAVAAGSTSLAGCSCRPDPSYTLSLDLEDLVQRDGTWRASVSATASFTDVDDSGAGVRGLSIESYTPTPTTQDRATVDPLLWGDVPDENREEDDCTSEGWIDELVELAPPEPPFYVSPLIDDRETLQELGSYGDFAEVTAIRYDGSMDEWPPADVGPGDYRTVTLQSLPYPAPDDVAATATPGLTSVSFDVAPNCAGGNRLDPSLLVGYDNDLSLDWSRPVPDSGARRPLLESIDRVGDELDVRIGLHDVPWEPEQDCELRPYEIEAIPVEGSARSITGATVEHVDASGATAERVFVPNVDSTNE